MAIYQKKNKKQPFDNTKVYNISSPQKPFRAQYC